MMRLTRSKNNGRLSWDTLGAAACCWPVSPNVRRIFVSSARVAQPNESVKTMKKTPSKKSAASADDVQPEYDFDYRKAKTNRFASRYQSGSRVVVLDADVAKVFTTPDSVNAVLRALMETMPKAASRS